MAPPRLRGRGVALAPMKYQKRRGKKTKKGGDPFSKMFFCSFLLLLGVRKFSYLVDPSSSHMLVSKIKPCMSKYKLSHSETANGSLDQLWFIRSYNPYLDNCGNSRANTCNQAPTCRQGRALLLVQNQSVCRKAPVQLVTLDNFVQIARPRAGDVSFKCLPYQLS